MKYKLSCIFWLALLVFSCKNENQSDSAETKKDSKKRALIYEGISKDWSFYDTPINEAAEASMASWPEFRQFLAELAIKPKKTIGAFQQRATAIAKKSLELNNNIPILFNTPPIKSRISTLITKVGMLNLFIHLDHIPDKKVVVLVSEINIELSSLQREMDKIVEKSKIPVEEGEANLKQLLDASRAIPSTPIAPNK